jgi:hypothetical protein
MVRELHALKDGSFHGAAVRTIKQDTYVQCGTCKKWRLAPPGFVNRPDRVFSCTELKDGKHSASQDEDVRWLGGASSAGLRYTKKPSRMTTFEGTRGAGRDQFVNNRKHTEDSRDRVDRIDAMEVDEDAGDHGEYGGR